MPRVTRRGYIASVGSAATLGVAGCLGGDSDGSDQPQIGVTQHLSGGAWVTAFFEAGEWYAEQNDLDVDVRIHDDSTSEQISDIQQFIAEDFDGIIAAPFDEAVDGAIEEADDAGIPVFCANDPGSTDAISSYTGFDNHLAGETCADLMLEAFDEQDDDQDEYEVLHVRGPFTQAGNARTDGFDERMGSEDGVEVVATLETEWTEDTAQDSVLSWLSGNDAPDGIYSSNMTSGLGTHAALEQLDLDAPFGEDDHIVLTQPDGGPRVHPLIESRHIYAAVDQPNYYYIPLAMRQLLNYLEDGEESLPEPGTTVDENDLTIESAHIDDIDQELWTDPIWAPASVEERNGHPHVLTESITITQDNVDAEHHWGNIWDDE